MSDHADPINWMLFLGVVVFAGAAIVVAYYFPTNQVLFGYMMTQGGMFSASLFTRLRIPESLSGKKPDVSPGGTT